MLARIRAVVRALLGRRRFEAELEEELRGHIDRYVQDLTQAGLSPAEAYRRARLEFGGVQTVKDACRQARGLALVDVVTREGLAAARQLWRARGFTLTVMVTLALAIGANTAIFSLVNALLLHDLPYFQADRIGMLYARTTGPTAADARRTVDGEQWEALRDEVPSLVAAISSSQATGTTMRGPGGPGAGVVRYVRAGRISARYLDVLALQPVVGRGFSEAEDRPGGPKAAILSYALWQELFGGRMTVLDEAVVLKGAPHAIVGVLPEGATTPLGADVYTALQPDRQGEGRAANFVALVRLKDGASWLQADAELQRALSRSSRFRQFTAANPGRPLTYHAVPLQRAATQVLRPQLLGLMLASAVILIIACANIAGLSLVRTIHRRSEVIVRLALGASRWQVQRQLWIEHLLLAGLGGLAGVGVGALALRTLLQVLPERFLPVATVGLDGRVLAFTLGLSLLTCILSGVLPAWSMGRVELRSAAPGRGVIGGGNVRLRQALIIGEVALTVVLLAAAGLLMRTLIGLQAMPPGFDATGVITAKASLDDVRYHDPAAFRQLLADSLSRMAQIPGVESAAVGQTLPYERALLNSVRVASSGQPARAVMTNQVYVTPRYFETLQIPLVDGRPFTDSDGPSSQPVAIVNRTFARKFFPQESPVGHYLDDRLLIVGIVADTILSAEARLNPGAAPLTHEETVFVPAAQVTDAKLLALAHVFFEPSWIVRTSNPAGVPARMQDVLGGSDAQLAVSGFFDINDLMAATLARQRIATALLIVMSALALLLSAVGIFALVANIVAQRTREIGILMALGATLPQTMVRVGRMGVQASAVGVALGLLLCAALLPAMRSVIYGVSVFDPRTLAGVVLTLGIVTLLATTPVLRIARIDPVKALRQE